MRCNMKKHLKIGTAFLLFICLTLSACQNNAGNNTNTLYLAVNDSATSINYLYTILEPNIGIISNITEGLVGYDQNRQLTPLVAESWDISDDGKTYTFDLRADAKWSNGDAVTASDFIYSIQTRIKDPEAVYKNYFSYLKNGEQVLSGEASIDTLGVSAPSDTQLVFELETPKALFLDLLAFEIFYPLNQNFYEQTGAADYGTSAETIISNGAYAVVTFNPSEGWTLNKNQYYWDSKNVALDNISVRVVKEQSTQMLMWENGELDAMDLTADSLDKYADSPFLHSALTSRMNYFYLSDNTGVSEPILGNINFRAAIAHSIDKQVIADSILKDGSIGADYFVPKDILFLDGSDYQALNNREQTPLLNVQTAQDYLAKAKSELNQTQFEFTLNIYDLGETGKIYENIKAQIEQNLPEVTVNLNMIPTQTYFQLLYEYNTPAAASQWEPDYLDIENYFLLFNSTASQNLSRWNNPDFDSQYNLAESPELAKNPIGRWEQYAKAEETLINDYTIIPVYQTGISYLVKDNIQNYQISPAIPHIAYKYIKKT